MQKIKRIAKEIETKVNGSMFSVDTFPVMNSFFAKFGLVKLITPKKLLAKWAMTGNQMLFAHSNR